MAHAHLLNSIGRRNSCFSSSQPFAALHTSKHLKQNLTSVSWKGSGNSCHVSGFSTNVKLRYSSGNIKGPGLGPSNKLRYDQCRNFESQILQDICCTFAVEKSHTTQYNPMCDGLSERMNQSLITLLRTLPNRGTDWEEHLQLFLFFYRTSHHASLHMRYYLVLHIPPLRGVNYIDPATYCTSLQHKLLEMRELVEANIAQSASDQQN